MKKFTFFLLSLVCCGVIADHGVTAKMFRGIRTDDLQGRTGLNNPERGLRSCLTPRVVYDTKIKPGSPNYILLMEGGRYAMSKNYLSEKWHDSLDLLHYDGITVVQTYIYLRSFYNRPISPEVLQEIEKIFADFRRYGAKSLVKFCYECMQPDKYGPDAETVLQHVQQLKPLLRRNSDVIFALEAGFIGAWGEWHSSVQNLHRNLPFQKKLIYALLDALPADRMILVRYPAIKVQALGDDFQELTEKTAFSGTPCARIGYHNDGILAGETHGGTFNEPPFGRPGNKAFDLMARESRYVGVEGELFWGFAIRPEKLDFLIKKNGGTLPKWAEYDGRPIHPMAAIKYLRQHHVTTLSAVHGNDQFEGGKHYSMALWKNFSITPDMLKKAGIQFSPEYFKCSANYVMPRSAYEFIRDHLGYRLEMRQATYPNKVAPGKTIKIAFSMLNRGFAAPINPRPVFISLIDAAGKRYDFPVKADPRRWFPAETGGEPVIYPITADLTLPTDLAPGKCRLGIWLPDAAPSLRQRGDYCIRLANGDISFLIDSERRGGINMFGDFDVQK